MTQIDGQMRQELVDIQAFGVPVEHSPHSERMAKTPKVGASGVSVDSQAANNAQESSADGAVGKRGTRLGDKESLGKTVTTQAFACRRIAAQGFGGAGIDRHQSRSEEHTSEL